MAENELKLVYDIKAFRLIDRLDKAEKIKRAQDEDSVDIIDSIIERVRIGLLRDNPNASVEDAEKAIEGMPIHEVQDAITSAITGDSPGKKN
jgi:hypothetical protein